MKRKVLVLTMGVICATQLWHSNQANALVTESVETNFVVKIRIIKIFYNPILKLLLRRNFQ